MVGVRNTWLVSKWSGYSVSQACFNACYVLAPLQAGSVAAAAGLKRGDVIRAVEGARPSASKTLRARTCASSKGRRLPCRVLLTVSLSSTSFSE